MAAERRRAAYAGDSDIRRHCRIRQLVVLGIFPDPNCKFTPFLASAKDFTYRLKFDFTSLTPVHFCTISSSSPPQLSDWSCVCLPCRSTSFSLTLRLTTLASPFNPGPASSPTAHPSSHQPRIRCNYPSTSPMACQSPRDSSGYAWRAKSVPGSWLRCSSWKP